MDQIDTAQLEQLPPEILASLPDELRQALEVQREERLRKIEAIGEAISKKRDDAVNRRGDLEQQWREDEEAYLGIDDATRDSTVAYKPASPNGSFQSTSRGGSKRSKIVLNITRPYVDAAAARVADMVMPTDERNWSAKPTPKTKLVERLKRAGQAPETFEQAVDQLVAKADAQAKRDEQQIEDWLVQANWHAEFRKVLEDSARIGVGVMKGPTPIKRKIISFKQGAAVVEFQIDPESRAISPWNFFPDPACGSNIHNGSFVFEKDDISCRKLRDLKGTPGYLAEQIDKVIEEGPGKKYVESAHLGNKSPTMADEMFEIWYYYGLLDRDDLMALGLDPQSEDKMLGVPVIVTLVNDTPIKAALNPLDTGEFPYDVLPWQRRPNSWVGDGVGRQIRAPQRMLTAANRNMMDNAGLSGGPIMLIRRGAVEPADGSWELTPRKMFYINEDADVKSVNDAVASIIVPSNQVELMNIINFALKIAEDVTGLPMIMQGQQGAAPDTVGGMQIINNNASTVLRRLARTIDDCITEPHIRRYHTWLMLFDPDGVEDRDCYIDARGSSALVERDLQNQAIINMGNFVLNPVFGLDPELWMTEWLRAQRLDPKRFQLSEQKKKLLSQQPPPVPYQVQVATIRANADLQRAKMDTDRDTVYVQAEMRRDQINATMRIEELKLKREIAYLEAQLRRGIEVDSNKVKLADTAARLRTQKELAFAAMAGDLHKHHNPQVVTPAVEPPGRAPAGQAFQR